MELETTARHANPMGTLHGGILCDVADAAMGIAFATTLEDDETFTTLDLTTKFLATPSHALTCFARLRLLRSRQVASRPGA
jgi:uncharacterized protein (TIGR00369 family)